MRCIVALVSLAGVLHGPGALAQAQPVAAAPAAAPAIQTVRVQSVRNPVDKSYKKMISGMDRFDRHRALAPQATLRFRLLPRLPNSRLEGVTLRVVGDNISIPLPVAPDFSFVLPRNTQAFNEDAAVIASRRSDTMTWRAWVQSPGLAPGTRRLGDLRLECLVGMESGLISNSSPVFAWLSNMLSNPDEVCGQSDGNYLFFSDRPLFSVILRHGERSEVLPFNMLYAGGRQTPDSLPFCDCQVLLDRSYYAPLWDRSWPDDTIVDFEYMHHAGGQP